MGLPTFAEALREAGQICSPEERALKARLESGATAIDRLSQALRLVLPLALKNLDAVPDKTKPHADALDVRFAIEVLDCYGSKLKI